MANTYNRSASSICSADFTLPGAERHYPPDLELEPVHTEIRLTLDLDAQSAAGTVTHTVRAARSGPREITFDAVDLEDVDVSDPSGASLAWHYDGNSIQVAWDGAFDAGEERRVAVEYRVVKPSGGLYFSAPTDEYPDEPLYAATDHETERARHWLPCIDSPAVRPRLDFHLTAAGSLTILANGALMDETDNGDGTKTAHWRLDYPCPSYLTCFAIGDFVRADDETFTQDGEQIPVAYFCTDEHTADDLMRSFGRTPDMLAWLTAKLDEPFPFPKYFQFALPGFVGAMENISLVSWNDLYVTDEVLHQELGHLVDAVNIHEMAHSYFGDAIVIRDYAHAWLKESWATYTETLWWEDTAGPDEADYDYYVNALAYFEEADSRYQRPIVTREFSSSWDMYDRHLYPGGACRLHTLRKELGDDTFVEGLRLYVDRHMGNVVETEDFRRAMEDVSGRSLVRWFDQWIYSPGYPALKVTFKYDAKKKEGRFDVEQTQSASKASSDKSGAGKSGDDSARAPVFRMHLDLAWIPGDAEPGSDASKPQSRSAPDVPTSNASDEAQSAATNASDERRSDASEKPLQAYSTQTVELRDAKHTFFVHMPHAPRQVRVDPHHHVLHKLDFNPGDELLRRQLTDAPDVIGRIAAATELAKTGRRKNIEAIRDAHRTESFWGARLQFARALADSGADAAVEALAEIIRREDDPKVMAWTFAAAGKYRDARIRESLLAKLEAGLPYMAERMAYEALGGQRQAAPLDVLRGAARRPSPMGIAQSGAVRGLALSRHPEAADVLLGLLPYGAASNRVRPAVALALGDLARVQPRHERERVVELLADGLRDPHPRVRPAAMLGLRAAGDTSALGALEDYRRALPHQEQVGVDRAVQAIRKAQESASGKSEKELEELRTELRKLKGEVEELRARVDKDDDGDGPDSPAGGDAPAPGGMPASDHAALGRTEPLTTGRKPGEPASDPGASGPHDQALSDPGAAGPHDRAPSDPGAPGPQELDVDDATPTITDEKGPESA